VLGLFAGVGPALAGLPPGYTIIELGPAPGGNPSFEVRGINNKGQVIGIEGGVSHPQSWIWLPTPDYGLPAGMSVLARPGSAITYVWDINDAGQVVGGSTDGAFLWQSGSWSLGGDSTAFGINNAGQVVGTVTGSLGSAAWSWPGGPLSNLPKNSQARAVNDAGQVVGDGEGPDRGYFASSEPFMWHAGEVTWLGMLGGNTTSQCSAWGINASGMVVGWARTEAGGRAFFWQEGVGMVDLGTLGGSGAMCWGGINDAGQVVGSSNIVSDLDQHGFIWEDGVLHDLNDFLPPDSGWDVRETWDINNSGWIAGTGIIDGRRSLVILVPIPEPATLSLLALGGLLVLRRRGRHGG
jgi:probable HAF family extracellular repeat protein